MLLWSVVVGRDAGERAQVQPFLAAPAGSLAECGWDAVGPGTQTSSVLVVRLVVARYQQVRGTIVHPHTVARRATPDVDRGLVRSRLVRTFCDGRVRSGGNSVGEDGQTLHIIDAVG